MTEDEQLDVVANDLGEMALCDCGGVNLTVGALTLHLQPDELADLHALAAAALELANPERRPAPQPEERSASGRKDKLGRVLH